MAVIRDILYLLFAVVCSPVILFYLISTGKWRTDWAGRFGKAEVKQDDRKRVLIHAVSVGEVNAIRELVRLVEEKYHDEIQLIICVATNTGTARAKALFEEKHTIVRFPYDFSFMVRRFFNRVQPDLVLLVELELWPNFLRACRKRKIPACVINGRLSERSFENYHKFKLLFKGMFASLDRACVQDDDYAQRFKDMGCSPDLVEVTGTMKWDTVQIVDEVEGADVFGKFLGIDPERPLVVCGSTGPDEEKMLLDQLKGERVEGQYIQLLFAPRKPERFDEVAQAIGPCVRRSECEAGKINNPDKHDVFLLDSIGELNRAYALCGLAIVGRSFCPLYGSDMVEPIALGKPTLIGPNTKDFEQMVNAFKEGHGLVQLHDIDEVLEAVELYLGSVRGIELAKAGRKVIEQQKGASLRHLGLIESFLGL